RGIGRPEPCASEEDTADEIVARRREPGPEADQLVGGARRSVGVLVVTRGRERTARRRGAVEGKAEHASCQQRGEPIRRSGLAEPGQQRARGLGDGGRIDRGWVIVGDRKSTRLNSSHVASSYAVFCLKKKKAASG